MYRAIYILLILTTFVSCNNSEYTEGFFIKTSGSGTVFSNDELYISKRGTDKYIVRGLKDSFPEWTAWAKLDKENQLYWSDKSLPIKVVFQGNKAKLLYGNGTFGEFNFERKNDSKNSQGIWIDELKYFLDKEGNIGLGMSVQDLGLVFGGQSNRYNDTQPSWNLYEKQLTVFCNLFDNKVDKIVISADGESQFSGFPFNIVLNASKLSELESELKSFKPIVNPVYSYDEINSNEIVGYYLTFEKYGRWAYFYFDKNKKLVSVSLASYDIANTFG